MRNRLWMVCGLMLAAGAARAQPAGGEPWVHYIGVLGTYGILDEGRAPNIGEGLGPLVLYGAQHPGGFGYELQGFGSIHETRGGSTDFYRWGFGADLVYSLGDRLGWTPFALAGASYALNDVAPDTLDGWDWALDGGVGVVSPPQFRDFFRVRVEGRAIYDRYGAQLQGSGYLDYQVGVGVEFLPRPLPGPPLGAEERVRVVEVATGLTDSDDDGVIDARDRCPDSPPGARVDGSGCPLPRIWQLNGVTFEVDKARLRPDSLTILNDVAAVLLRYPDMAVEVAGHTDSTGGEAYNERLSRRRAESVRNHLIRLGIPPQQLELRGYGEYEPLLPNRTAAGRERNRRVELHITGGSGVPGLQGKP